MPKWLSPGCCGARFSFGNRLISFEKPQLADPQIDPATLPRTVTVSQVLTDFRLKQRAEQLESALKSGTVADFCESRCQEAQNDEERTLWKFLKAHCEGAGRKNYALALGIGIPLGFF